MKLEDAKEGVRAVGMWMETRYVGRLGELPIQRWDIPREEKGFFTVYAGNVMMESDGFDVLAGQKAEDVQAFIEMLRELGAEKTSAYVQQTLAQIKAGEHSGGYGFTKKYYDLFKEEKVWIRLFNYLGWPTYTRYVLKAQSIQAAGEHLFDPKQWQGELPDV